MDVELWPIEDVTPYEGNPRQNEEAVGAVAASIREFGFRQPIVVDEGGVVICGHTRLAAAKELGLARVPVHVAEGLTPDQVKAYRLADNATRDRSEWDYDLLPLELADLNAAGFDLGLLGFEEDELARIMVDEPGAGQVDPNMIPAPPDEPVTQAGDLWVLGEHRLLCGDAGSAADVDRLIGEEGVDLVNTDPPYNVRVEPRSNNAISAGLSSFSLPHHQSFGLARGRAKADGTTRKMRPKDRPLKGDDVSDGEFAAMLRAWFGQMARVLDPGRSFYIWGSHANIGNYAPALKECGLYFSQSIIWIKEHPVPTHRDFMGNHEWCFYGWREDGAHRWYGPTNVPDVWSMERRTCVEARGAMIGDRGVRVEAPDRDRVDVVPPAVDAHPRLLQLEPGQKLTLYGPGTPTDVWFVKKVTPQSMVHLTEKPVELAVRAMQYSSKRGENVLDLFGGSGSTLIAAEQMGRRAFLMEMDTLYCDVIVRRWEEFTGQKAEREGV